MIVELRWLAIPICILLVGSLICNIFALIYPFLEFSAAFKGKELYSIPHTIQLMWDLDLYVIAILIVAFSLTFPFVKLVLLGTILLLPMTRSGRHRTLSTLRLLGRWSLLDVFVALIILILADDQIFIGAKPRIGVTLFLIAICTSMFTSELLKAINAGGHKSPADPLAGRRTPLFWASGWMFWLMTPLLILSGGTLILALGLPFFKIDQFLLSSYAYSVVKSVSALTESGATSFAITILMFLVATPILKLIAMAVSGFIPMNRSWRRGAMACSEAIGDWAMLDVFALALVLFLFEGSRLVKFKIQDGLYMIIVAVVVYYITLFVGVRLVRRVISRSDEPGATTL